MGDSAKNKKAMFPTRSVFLTILKGVCKFYGVWGVGARQPQAVFFPEPQTFPAFET
jgi:hypothetical protein